MDRPAPVLQSRPFALSEDEAALFDFLLTVVRERAPHVEMRVAGGWVRDRLLGRVSHDIDIALNVMGRDFAELVNEGLAARQAEAHKIGVIAARPGQSKHLETATMRVLGFWIDFVNLRADGYDRPDQAHVIGTPLEDALRRDLTVNALFYNIGTDHVEDWSGLGISDIAAKLLRTPLSPDVTLHDDPCRILRAIRFSARLDFALSSELARAGASEAVRAVLCQSIARERIGKELVSMLPGPRFVKALATLGELQLIECVVRLPLHVPFKSVDAAEAVRNSLAMEVLIKELVHMPVDSEDGGHGIFAAFLRPWHGLVILGTETKRRPQAVLEHVLLDGLRFGKKECEFLMLLLNSAKAFEAFIESVPSRCALGRAVRVAGSHWPLSVALACTTLARQGEDGLDCSRAIAEEQRICRLIDAEGLREAHTLAYFYHGGDLMSALDLKPGPHIARLLESQMDWLLSNPRGSKDECLAFLADTAQTGGWITS